LENLRAPRRARDDEGCDSCSQEEFHFRIGYSCAAWTKRCVTTPCACRLLLLLSCGAPEPLGSTAPATPARFDAAQVAHGARLAAVGNCITCHTAPGGKPYAGGYPLHTPFGTVHGTNITPDAETGIGRWSLADFDRAMREGIDPRGRHYYPAFPYDYFTRLTDADIAALYAFVMTREAVRASEPDNHMLVPRVAVGIWKSKYFHPGRLRPDSVARCALESGRLPRRNRWRTAARATRRATSWAPRSATVTWRAARSAAGMRPP
jgi:mono/diheme cytochrome c family protein